MKYSEEEMTRYLQWYDSIPDPGGDYPKVLLLERYNETLPRRERYKPAIDYTSLHGDSVSWRIRSRHDAAQQSDPDAYDRGWLAGYYRQPKHEESEAYLTGYCVGWNKKTTEEDS